MGRAVAVDNGNGWQWLATSRRGSGVALSEDEDKEFSFEK